MYYELCLENYICTTFYFYSGCISMKNEILQIAVVGGGSWGTAVAQTLSEKGHKISLILRDKNLVDEINSKHENTRYLANYKLNSDIYATTDLSLLSRVNIIVLAVPTQNLRAFLHSAKDYFNPNAIVVNTAKGFEVQSGQTIQYVVNDVLGCKTPRYAVLSGPSFAAEVMKKNPTVVVLACAVREIGEDLRDAFSSDNFRCYSSEDVMGVEVGGALKNIIAIAAGIVDGLGFGSNTRAALVTRALAEMSRIGVSLGGRATTFMGLSGLGDLMLTCTGDLSRNRQVGLRLGAGESLENILDTLGMVAEGVKTTEAVYYMTKELNVNSPIIHAVYDVLYNKSDPRQAVLELMRRDLKHEKI